MMKRYLLIALTLLVGLSTPVVAQQGMLKAFGLKGKVKTVTFEDDFTIAFDPQGNYIGTPDYKGGEVSIDVNEGRSCAKFVINNWKWTGWERSYGMGMSYDYTVTAYDQQNRPGKVSLECVGGGGYCDLKNIPVIYSGSDSHGNYTQINFDKTNVKGDDQLYLTPISVKCTYWPEDATMADVANRMTDAQAAALIRKANLMDAESLSKELRNYLKIQATIPRILFYASDFGGDNKDHFHKGMYWGAENTTLISGEEGQNVSNIEVRINEQNYGETGEKVLVYFHFKDRDTHYGNTNYDPFYERSNFRVAECVFEDGKWRVADMANSVEWITPGGFDIGEDWRTEAFADETKEQLAKINSGEFEREVRQKFASDPKLPEYIDYIKAFKQKLNGNSGRNSSSEPIYTAVEEAPSFPGGEMAMYQHLSKNIRYPEVAARNNIHGRVTLQFVVEKDGSIGEIKVVRGTDPDLDREAVRVVKTLPRFIPGKMHGEPVRVWYTLPVNFKMQ